jgi:hypothetical protein
MAGGVRQVRQREKVASVPNLYPTWTASSDPDPTSKSAPPANGMELSLRCANGILTAASSGRGGREERITVEPRLTRFRCEPIPRAAVRLVSPAMGHAKPGQGPVIRNVTEITRRLTP